jgi:hypothetical protein
MDASFVPTEDSGGVPPNISASGARRFASQSAAAAAGVSGAVPPGMHGHVAVVSGAAPDDPVDGIAEAALRKHTGEEKQFHDRIEHVHYKQSKEVDPARKPRVKPRRRPGFGSMSASRGRPSCDASECVCVCVQAEGGAREARRAARRACMRDARGDTHAHARTHARQRLRAPKTAMHVRTR